MSLTFFESQYSRLPLSFRIVLPKGLISANPLSQFHIFIFVLSVMRQCKRKQIMTAMHANSWKLSTTQMRGYTVIVILNLKKISTFNTLSSFIVLVFLVHLDSHAQNGLECYKIDVNFAEALLHSCVNIIIDFKNRCLPPRWELDWYAVDVCWLITFSFGKPNRIAQVMWCSYQVHHITWYGALCMLKDC